MPRYKSGRKKFTKKAPKRSRVDTFDANSISSTESQSVWVEVSQCGSNVVSSGLEECLPEVRNPVAERENAIGFREFLELDEHKRNVDQVVFGLTSDGFEVNLDLNLSHVDPKSAPSIDYDVDSLALKFEPESVLKSITLSLTCATSSLMSKDYGFVSNNSKLIHIPHLTFGCISDWTVHIFFPGLFDPKRMNRNGVPVFQPERVLFLEQVLYPSLNHIASPLLRQRLPTSYAHACAIASGNSPLPLRLSRFDFVELVEQMKLNTRNLKQFANFEIYATMKGKKFEFTSPDQYHLLIEEVAFQWFDKRNVSNFFIDVAKTFTSNDEGYSYCFKKGKLKDILKKFSGRKDINVFKTLNCEDIEGANVKMDSGPIR